MSRYAVIDVGTNSVKFHIGEREDDGSWRTIVDRSEITRLGEGREQTGALQPEPMARTVDAIAGMAEQAGRKASRRSQPSAPRRSGLRPTAPSSSRPCRRAPASRSRSSPVRRRRGSPTSPRRRRSTPGRAARRVRQRRRQLPVHVRERGEVDERFSVPVGAVRPTERFGLDGPVSEQVLAEALRVRRGRPRAPRRPPGPGRARGHGRDRHQPRGREARARRATTPTSSRAPCSTARRSTARSSSTGRARRRAPRDRRPATETRRDHPRRRLHHPDRDGEARPGLVDRERPGPEARPPRRAVRIGQKGADMATTTTKRSSAVGGGARELVALMGSSDSVELKVTLPVSEHRGDDPGARARPARCPDQAGVLLRHARARALQGRRRRAGAQGPGRSGDTVVKLRPVKPDDCPRTSGARRA